MRSDVEAVDDRLEELYDVFPVFRVTVRLVDGDAARTVHHKRQVDGTAWQPEAHPPATMTS